MQAPPQKEYDAALWASITTKSGDFKRPVSAFREWVSKDPSSKFPAEKGRYHLYVSYACPWAHRTLIARQLKGLEDIISFSSVHWHLDLETGWRFPTLEDTDAPGENVTPDPFHPDFTHMRQVYFETNPDYTGRFSVPVLYDKIQKVVVNNESSEILQMLATEFDDLIDEKYRNITLFPEAHKDTIDEVLQGHYDSINNGVYKCGVATTQEAYERAVTALFEGLDKAEKHLASSEGPYWYGKEISAVDIRLFVTIIRFDPVYVQHFKCNIRDIRSGYPALHKWVRNLYWNVPGFRDSTEFTHIKQHYMKSHKMINPFSISPAGPLPHILPVEQEVPAAQKA
ncbi:glutathione S-transferase [Mariannaea sp. PMI_226]|nr:glutathione S-transferase [Mariannaea sp. PMI_226]